tara:strand:- start:6 stop:482 length:477 start_codon:yes stop_codon:yes gene_type:complete
MKHLAVIVAMFLLMGCQTTNTIPPKDTSPKVEPKVEKTEHQGKKPNVPTVISTMKPLMCGDPTTTLNAVLNVAKEKPLAMWKDVQTGYNVIMLYNKETRQNTILEYIPGPYVCFLSVGKDVHVVGVDLNNKKTGVSVQRGLTKPLKHGINIVQFDDAD